MLRAKQIYPGWFGYQGSTSHLPPFSDSIGGSVGDGLTSSIAG